MVNRLKAGIPGQGCISGKRPVKVLLVEFRKTLRTGTGGGGGWGLPPTVGAESKYEMIPMFYRVSGTFRKADPTLEHRMIRINPMRAGADTILRIIKESVERVK
ncbi:MAG: hypothetical protein ACLUN9_02225 [Enterocloster aldenensis]